MNNYSLLACCALVFAAAFNCFLFPAVTQAYPIKTVLSGSDVRVMASDTGDDVIASNTAAAEDGDAVQYMPITLRQRQLWSLPIFYTLDDSYTEEEKEVVRRGIERWQEVTCVTFSELLPANGTAVTSSSQQQRQQYLSIKNADVTTGCSSHVGKVSPTLLRPQDIALSSACLRQVGTVEHELGHALGLWHEHQRPDRGDYVMVHPENSLAEWAASFDALTYQALGLGLGHTSNLDLGPYDFNSVMHYGALSGSVNSQPTIVAKSDPMFVGNMGQRADLSFWDSRAVNAAYCHSACVHHKLDFPCLNNGYQDPVQCDTCRCPQGLGGRYCDTVAPSTAECGGSLWVGRGENVTLTSPPPNSQSNVAAGGGRGVKCHWLVSSNESLTLTFGGQFRLERLPSLTCLHWVEISAGPSLATPTPRYCGDDLPPLDGRHFGKQILVTLDLSQPSDVTAAAAAANLDFEPEDAFYGFQLTISAPATATTATTAATAATTAAAAAATAATATVATAATAATAATSGV